MTRAHDRKRRQPDDTAERTTEEDVAQRSGTLTGQGDAVDTEDSAGAITETTGTTAGRRVDQDESTAKQQQPVTPQGKPVVHTKRPANPDRH